MWKLNKSVTFNKNNKNMLNEFFLKECTEKTIKKILSFQNLGH